MRLGIRRKRRWPLLLGGLVGACGLFVAFAATFGVGPYDMPGQSRRLDEVIEESKRLGLPMTQADLKPKAQVPDDQNAAPDVMRFAEKLGRSQISIAASYLNLDPTDRAELDKAVTKAGPYLDAIVETLESKTEWFVDRDYDIGPNLLLPEFAHFKSFAKIVSARAVIRAEGGDAEGAIRDLRAVRDLRQRSVTEPFLIAMLVAIAIDSIALRASESVMTALGDDPEALSQIEAMLLETEHRIDPRPALRGEFYMALAITRNLKAYGGYQALAGTSSGSSVPKFDPGRLQRSGLPKGMWQRAFMTSLAGEWNLVFQSFDGAESPPRGWGAAIDARSDEMAEKLRISEIMVQILFPVFGQADAALSTNDVDHDIHLALVRVLKFRAENGRMPESLEEVGAAFTDPFSGSTIRAILTEDEVRIWTVGRNGVDDGGLRSTRTNRDRDDHAAFWPATKRAEHAEK